MKVLVCGRERFTNRKAIHFALDKTDYERGSFTEVAQFGSGSNGGPDAQVRMWVWERWPLKTLSGPWKQHLPALKTHHHDYDRFGPGAHHKTYERVLKDDPPDLVIVLGPEQGTHRPFVRAARARGIEIVEFAFEHHLAYEAERAVPAGDGS